MRRYTDTCFDRNNALVKFLQCVGHATDTHSVFLLPLLLQQDDSDKRATILGINLP